MEVNLKDKKISNNGAEIVVNWRDVKIVVPDNLQEKVGNEEKAKIESQKQEKTLVKTATYFMG